MSGPLRNYPAEFRRIAHLVHTLLREAELLTEQAEALWEEVLRNNESGTDPQWQERNWDALAALYGYDRVCGAVSQLESATLRWELTAQPDC